MQKRYIGILVAAALGVGVSASSMAQVAGGSSNDSNVFATTSAFPFSSGKAGLQFNNKSSFRVDLAGGPVKYVNDIINANPGSGPHYLKGSDIGFIPGLFLGTIAQIWRDTSPTGADLYSLRQVITPAINLIPNFGGLVIGQVEGSPVFFGEWSPKSGGTIPVDSTDLNMTSNDRTVWYVGENPTTTAQLPIGQTAHYNVVGVGQYDPGSPNAYSGVLTAVFGPVDGALSNSISNGSKSVNFTGTSINYSNGSFEKLVGTNRVIQGQFYGNQAAALAGIYTGGTVQDHVAFGGAKQ